MYQRSGQLKPKTLNLDPLRRKNKNNRNSNRSSSKASTQASKQASKQTIFTRRAAAREEGIKTGTKTRGETPVDFLNRGKVESAFFFSRKKLLAEFRQKAK
jgi:hypothetical protein